MKELYVRKVGLKIIRLAVALASFLVIVCFGVLEAHAAVHFVKHDTIGGNNDGTSWADAFVELQSALDAALTGDEIWVAAGTYYPTSFNNLAAADERNKNFKMKNGVGIYGGFAGMETERSQRDREANVTILSGDIGTIDDASDNCYHVFYNDRSSEDLDETAVIDGFTITGGNANYPESTWSHHQFGGGFYNESVSVTVSNCVISGNHAGSWGGGGMSNRYSDPTVTNCVFENNSSGYYGGGMLNDASSPTIINCRFINNVAAYGGGMLSYDYSNPIITGCDFIGNYAATYGGGMWIYNYSDAEITNCTFIGNSTGADGYGGGMCLEDATSSTVITNCLFSRNSSTYGGGIEFCNTAAQMINCTFSGNSADYGGGIRFNYHAYPAIKNSIIYGNSAAEGGPEIYVNDYSPSNPTFSHCNIAGSGGSGSEWNTAMGTDNGENIDANPLFADAENDDLHLLSGSPCIDVGDSSAVPVDIATDLDGNDRIVGDAVDMGAFECQSSEPPSAFTLEVRSTPAGIIMGGPLSSVTNYDQMVENGARVILNAPKSYRINRINYEFVRWHLNEVPQPLRQNRLDFMISENTTAEAEYCIKKP